MPKPKRFMVYAAGSMLIALMILLALGGALLPVWLKYYLSVLYARRPVHFNLLMAILFLAALKGFFILLGGLQILISVSKERAFVPVNYRRLRRVGWLSFGISILFFLCAFVYLTPYTLVFIGAFALLGILAMIAADLIQQAIQIQEENDLTV